ncbi:MAG: hypothetical protein CL942_01830 [Desulfovibrio sp.]|nr:hypothetical protein [Desulfovibrio sp.]
MRRLLIGVCIAMAITLCLAATSRAHKVNLFAYVDGNSIVTDSGYSRSKRVHDGIIEVYDAATGTMLLSGETDDNGKYDFIIPDEARSQKMDLLLRLKAGTGHQAEWTVKYTEYGAAKGPFAASEPEHGHKAVAVSQESTITASEVEVVVRRELAPLKQMVSEMHQSGPGVTEIVGGIGYIVGLFGIVAYMKSRRS